MERGFIVSKESKYVKDHEEYSLFSEQQRKFVNDFLNYKGIKANEYMVGGDGFVNCAFSNYSKSDITLSIIPTEDDFKNFGKMLTKPNKNYGLCSFKKKSIIAKEFAQKCIDEKIIINLHRPRMSDYFESLGYHGGSYQQFLYNDVFYLKVESEHLKDDDLPEGFNEIKLSEFYSIKEKFEAQ